MSYNFRDSTMSSNTNTGSNVKGYSLIEDVPDYGSAFVCGKSRFESEKFHVKNDPIVQVSCGDEHSGLVTESGRVFMFGSNNWGQLGLGHENNVEKPSCIKSLKQEKSILIACGRNHTIVATDSGNIYTFGCNSESQLGLGESNNSSFYNSPQRIESLKPQNWKQLSAGAGQSFALTERGDVYVWGINDNGELGLGKINEQFDPKRLDLGFPVTFVSCGYYHSAIVSDRGELLTSGSDEYFQLGHGRPDKKFHPVERVRDPVKAVACGAGTTIFVTSDGYVFSMGDGAKGQLGLGNEALSSKSPKQIKTLDRYIITSVSSGECHTAFITNKGQLLTCGDNRYGKLGHSQKTFNSIQYDPIVVDKYQELNVKFVACGGCHMILMGKVAETPTKLNASKMNDKYDKVNSSSKFSDDGEDLYNKSYTKSVSTRNNNNYGSRDAIRDKREDEYKNSSRSRGHDLKPIRGSGALPDLNKKPTHRRFSDSESDVDNPEAEYTFNRTHTLTRDHGFVPLSETNLKKAAEESMNKFGSSHSTVNRNRNGYENDSKMSSSSRGRYDDKYDAKKPDPVKKPSMNSDSDDDFLFNRKKFINAKSQQENYATNNTSNSSRFPARNERSFTPIDEAPLNMRATRDLNTNKNGSLSSRNANEPLPALKPYKPVYGTSSMNRQSDDSDQDGPLPNRGHSSDRTNRRNVYNGKRSDTYSTSSTNMRVSSYNPNPSSRDNNNGRPGNNRVSSREDLFRVTDRRMSDELLQTEKVNTRCFKKNKSPNDRRDSRDNRSRDEPNDNENESSKPSGLGKIKTCSIL